MKTLILISTFALSALIVSAAYPKPATILIESREEKFTDKELDLLANSAVFQRAAVRYIFRRADANKSGNLDLAELKTAYSYLARNGYSGFDGEFIQNEFNQGNFVKNQVISIDEFAFLFNRWVKFMSNNLAVYTWFEDRNIQSDKWDEISNKINKNIYYAQGDAYARICQGFNTDGNSGITFDEYKSGLQKLEDTTGLLFTSDDYTMRDSYELMLSPCDTIVSEDTFRNYMTPFLKSYIETVKYYVPMSDYQPEEDYEQEEEYGEEE